MQTYQSVSAMILAAGRGERMRPLTDGTPKPLLQVRGKPLLQWHAQALARGGFRSLVINTAWLGAQIAGYSGAGLCPDAHPPLTVNYSNEGADFGSALETAGGIARALPMLGDIFWVLAGDVFAPDFQFSLHAVQRFARSDKLAHLWLVPNPEHNPTGDFGLVADPAAPGRQRVLNRATEQYTYSTIGLYRRELFAHPWCEIPAGNPLGVKAPLAPVLRRAIDNQQVSGEMYPGFWADVGTPQRLAQLNADRKT